MFSLLSDPILFVLWCISFAFCIGMHEFSHAFAADKLGDPTPRLQGRVTLNPLAHLDPLGTVAILLSPFGWGRAVSVDPFNFKHPRRDMGIVALAGPASNFIMATGATILLAMLLFFKIALPVQIIMFFQLFITMNVGLGLFNLIPIDPLDGYKVVAAILPEHKVDEWYSLSKYGFVFLAVLILPLINGQSAVSLLLSPLIMQINKLLLGFALS